MKPSELLRTTNWCQNAEAITSDGTIKDWHEDGVVGYCLLGAIFKCYGENKRSRDIYYKLVTHIDDEPVGWNDEPGRTKDEVISALEAIGE